MAGSISITHVKINNHELSFKLDPKSNDLSQTRLFLKERNMKKKYRQILKPHLLNGEVYLSADLSGFINTFANVNSRWNVFIEFRQNDVMDRKRLAVSDRADLPTHKRHFQSIYIESLNTVTPYITVYNNLSIVIKPEIPLLTEKVKSDIELTKLNVKRGKLSGEALLWLPECNEFQMKSILIKYRNEMEDIRYHAPAKALEVNDDHSRISFAIDLKTMKLEPLNWDLYLRVSVDNVEALIQIKNPTDKLKKSLKETDTGFSYDNNGHILHPYITINNALALRYREKSAYEGLLYRMKEKFALFVYKILKSHYDKEQICLVNEKFSETAQDNGFYFFKYAYQNHPQNGVYYIMDKKSPDRTNMRGMEDRVLHFMSLKHLIYLCASNLLVSSETKGHCYIFRKQSGRFHQMIDNKTSVFLQHGVIALKKVGPTYGKQGNHAVDLFAASSEFEKEIIKSNLGYDEEEIMVTGLCRWDALFDKSSESSKEILLMPTWRPWLDDVSEERFMASDYYKSYTALLNSNRLQTSLENNNITLNFYIHPKLKSFIDKFYTPSKNIKIYRFGEKRVNELLMKSSLLITDYSSVSWDEYYQKKPVIFYQFDFDKYDRSQGSYLDMKKDLFGDRATNSEKLISLMEEYIDRDFKEKKRYARLRKGYFKYNDRKNSYRTFKAIANKTGLLTLEGADQSRFYKKVRNNPIARALWSASQKNEMTFKWAARIKKMIMK